MPTSPSSQPQQNLDTGIFFEVSVPQQTADIIRNTVSITKTIVKILHRLGFITNLPKSPICIRQDTGNQVEVKLTLTHGTVKEIQEVIKAAITAIGFSLLAVGVAGGVIGYSCSRVMDSSKPSIAEPQPK